MNTPMHQLLSWMEENKIALNIPNECFEKTQSLIELEKAEIMKAREDGIYTMINGSIQDKQLTSEDYYNRIFSDNTLN